jgi:integrase
MKEYVFHLTHLAEFVSFRKASDCWNEDNYALNLRLFDGFCAKNWPDLTCLTQKMAETWCAKRKTEKNNSCIDRANVVIALINYLNARGLSEVIRPELPRKEKETYIPHAFLHDELERFFHGCDTVPKKARMDSILTRLCISTLFRLLYSSGIRTTEARLLGRKNVDLENGILNIVYSKGRNQHYVVLHDSMVKLLKQYDGKMQDIFPDRIFFFPNTYDHPHGRKWLTDQFRMIWDRVNPEVHAVPYDFRHNYAIENINKWISKGFGFDDKLTYLSKSMGHSSVESTKRYYSLVPALADLIEKQTSKDFDEIIPEVKYEESEF